MPQTFVNMCFLTSSADAAAVSDMFADDSLALAHTASYSAASAHSKLWRMASVKRMAAAQLPLASEWATGALHSALRSFNTWMLVECRPANWEGMWVLVDQLP
jgi:hypothetical protein